MTLLSRIAISRQARSASATAARLWESEAGLYAGREAVARACTMAGVQYPESRFGLYPEVLRTQSPEWWGRQIKKADRRGAEWRELKAGRINRYCSDLMLSARQQQKKDNRDMLAEMVAICETADGETLKKDLLELVKGSNANPAIRRAELMTRISGFEQYAKEKNQVAYFFTLTCPSKYHRTSRKWGANAWPDFTGPVVPVAPSPREANAYLCDTWARARAALKRADLELFGFRIAEPHKDACPHWHALFWFKSRAEAHAACRIIRAYFLAEDGREPGAKKNRVKIEAIHASKGTATGYIAKYICKNVDGIYTDAEGQATTFDDHRRNPETGEMEGTGMKADDAAARVDAWAACWGIRQFQQIGGPKVGAWRELRRLRDTETAPELEPMRRAADAGEWHQFCLLDDDHRTRYGTRVKVWTETSADLLRAVDLDDDEAVKACLNPWQEPTLRTVKGIAYGRDLREKTRFLKWTIMLRQAMEEAEKRAAALTAAREIFDYERAFMRIPGPAYARFFEFFGPAAEPPGREAAPPPLESCQ